jgi:hypothetical protein
MRAEPVEARGDAPFDRLGTHVGSSRRGLQPCLKTLTPHLLAPRPDMRGLSE